MSTHVYVDGFNLYYGALQGTAFKWLDVEAVCRRLVPLDRLAEIRYFTAPVKPRPGDPFGPQRQNALFRALRANPLVTVHLGHFRVDPAWQPLAPGPWADGTRPQLRPRFAIAGLQRLLEPRLERPPMVRVLKTEEKGSDVNIAAHLLHDVYRQGCTKALVISNDSDLAEPIRLAVAHGAIVGVVNPHRHNRMSRHLKDVASFTLQLRQSILPACQLPDPVISRRGTQIHKPAAW